MLHCVSGKTSCTLYICDNLVRWHPISPILGRNKPSGNLKQTHIHTSVVSICSYTVSCKNRPRFLRHTVQRQIRRLHIILTSDNYQVTLTVIRKKDCSYYQSKCLKISPISSHAGAQLSTPLDLVDCLVNDVLPQTIPCSNQAPLKVAFR